MDTIYQYGLPGILAYGTVGALALIVKYRTKNPRTGEPNVIPADVKLYLLIFFAFVYLFVPLEFGNIVLERIKLAIAIGLGITAANEAIKRV